MPNVSYTAFMSGILSFFKIIYLEKQTVYLIAGIKIQNKITNERPLFGGGRGVKMSRDQC